MKNIYKKLWVLPLLIFTVTMSIAQSMSTDKLMQDLQNLQKQLIPDKRVAILEIELKDTLQPTMVISGKTDLPEAKQQIISFLKTHNLAFIDSITVLPDVSLGYKTWALSTLSVSNMRAKPDDASELVSQTTMGTPLKVLEQREKWFRVQSPEKYIGWMDASGLQQISTSELVLWKNSSRCFFNQNTGYIVSAPNKKGEIVSDLVRGDLLEITASSNKFFEVKIPDGRTGFVRKNECILFDKWVNLQANAQSIIMVAQQMMGSPYLWGGASSKAADCSGFVKLAYFSQGLILARDASQQALYGEPIDISNRNNLLPGDLLFFGKSAQRITHVGIYVGNGDFIHSSGKVYISSVDPNNSKYNPTRNFVAARRIISAPQSDGIIQVKNHPWYIVQP